MSEDREALLLTALRSTIAALRRIDQANGALSEGAGQVLYDNPDRLAQAMNTATAHGQNAYLQASMLLGRLGIAEGPTEPVELTVVGFTGIELAALIEQAGRMVHGIGHLIEQAEAAERAGKSNAVPGLRARRQLWLGLSGRLTAAALAVQR